MADEVVVGVYCETGGDIWVGLAGGAGGAGGCGLEALGESKGGEEEEWKEVQDLHFGFCRKWVSIGYGCFLETGINSCSMKSVFCACV